MQHMKVRKFSMSQIKPHRISLLLGRRGAGKSVLLRDMLYHLRDRFDYVIAMCPTMESATMLKACMPAASVYDRFVPHKVEALIALAQDYVGKGKSKSFFLVLDDCMYEKSICRTPYFRNLFYNGRHYKITVAILLQYLVDITPDLRAQIDYVFTCREPIIGNKVKLHKMFFGVFGAFDDFLAVLERCTQNFEVLCLDNTLSTTGANQCVFWYKASHSLPDFSVGADVFYRLSNKYGREPGSSPPLEEGGEGGARRARITVTKEGEDGDEDGER